MGIMEMPVICQKCGNIFDLNDGYGSIKWFPNTVICESCYNKEGIEIEREERILDYINCIEDNICDIREYSNELKELNAFDRLSNNTQNFIKQLK